MDTEDYKIHPTSLFYYSAGVGVGVLVEDPVMRKLVKLQQKHLEEVKRLLSDNKDKVHPSMWTLHYPEGKQTIVHYIEEDGNVDFSIECATTYGQPAHQPLVFIAKGMKEAEHMANVHWDRTKG